MDSGIGGLSTLAETCKILPANYIYFADIKNCPYGNLSKKEISNLLKEIITKILSSYKIVMIVLACNTATTSAIDDLRKEFTNIPIIGTEPAVNLAKNLGYKNILALTTPATSKQEKYNNLVKHTGSNIRTLSMPSLAQKIENYFANQSSFNFLNLQKDIMHIKKISQNYDCVVLGCTHYVLVEDMIKNITQKSVINGNIGIARQVLKKLNTKYFQNNKTFTIKFLSSNSTNFAKEIYKKILGQILAKR